MPTAGSTAAPGGLGGVEVGFEEREEVTTFFPGDWATYKPTGVLVMVLVGHLDVAPSTCTIQMPQGDERQAPKEQLERPRLGALRARQKQLDAQINRLTSDREYGRCERSAQVHST